MSQNWVANLYTTGTIVDTTMSNVESMFATLKSSFSGVGAPGNTEAGLVWYDSNASYKCLQVRDSGDAAWRGIMAGSSANKVWLYLNAVEEGWTVDSGVVDVVLSLKGGATYVQGAVANQGTWTQPSHTLVDAEIPKHLHTITSGAAHTHTLPCVQPGSGGSADAFVYDTNGISIGNKSTNSSGAHSHTVNEQATGDGSHNHGTTYRPLAATGILAAPTARG